MTEARILKYYGNAVFVSLGVVGYLAVAGSYTFSPLIVLAPLLFLTIWAFTGGWIYAVGQFFYFLYGQFFAKPKLLGVEHHLWGVLMCGVAYLILFVGISNGLIVTV